MTPLAAPAGIAAAAPATLDIDLAAIVANWRILCARHPSGPVAGVVKADAYGLGAAPVATALHAAGCRHFFVALLDEALVLRPLLPDAMIAVLGGLLPGSEARAVAAGITPVLNTMAEPNFRHGPPAAAASADACRPCCTSTPACPASA
jgi:alanine racemase